MDDSFNYPLSLLLARLRAISGEADRFTTISGRLLDILANETRSLPRRANKMLARAGEDRSRASPGQVPRQTPGLTIYICRFSGHRRLPVITGEVIRQKNLQDEITWRVSPVSLFSG